MKTNHTPGQWHQSHREIPNNEDGMYATQIYTADGETIATISWYPKPEVNGLIETYRGANARLIVCAPEMLSAMIEFCERVEKGEVRSTKTYNKFKEIITKATL